MKYVKNWSYITMYHTYTKAMKSLKYWGYITMYHTLKDSHKQSNEVCQKLKLYNHVSYLKHIPKQWSYSNTEAI